MTKPSIEDPFTALAPLPEQLDQTWAREALARIVADEPPARSPRAARHRTAALALGGAIALTTGTGVAVATGSLDPVGTVKDVLLGFSNEPNTTGNTVGTIHDPKLVAEIERANGAVYAVWFATTSSGDLCTAETRGDTTWDGAGRPPPGDLDYGCAYNVVDPDDPDQDRVIQLTRPDQISVLFEEFEDPILYGVSPYDDAVAVHVRGDGVDRTLPLRPDSLGYGAALPGASGADQLDLTFLDAAGRTVGNRTVLGFDD